MKYRMLRITAALYKVLAWFVLVGGVLSICSCVGIFLLGGAEALSSATRSELDVVLGGVVSATFMIVIYAVFFLIVIGLLTLRLWAASENIMLSIDLEANSERTVALLEKIAGSASQS